MTTLEDIKEKRGWDVLEEEYYSPVSPWSNGRFKSLSMEHEEYGTEVALDSDINPKGHPEYYLEVDGEILEEDLGQEKYDLMDLEMQKQEKIGGYE
ncbi:hypothetical protein [Haloferax sp. Q22]|uniref:hypothetical protein n=1 Tax=Haloferax sp. (strain Q22) TaxID=1526048 RepID=UPI000737C769|nr:hypothetical protein [Haloferax sp. Q22]